MVDHLTRLNNLYYTPSKPSSFGGVKPLLLGYKNEIGTNPKKNFKEWLMLQNTYTLHKPARKRFPRGKYFVMGVDEQWQADLVEMQEYSSTNDGYRYLLTIIDIFSKYAWVVPLKTKTGKKVTDALETIFTTSGRSPDKFNTDKGKEFDNYQVKAMLKKYNVFFTTTSDLKATVIERFNRTLKTKMWRYFTYKNTERYIDVLSDIVTAYNNCYHRTIGMPPSKVTRHNQSSIFDKVYKQHLYPADNSTFAFQLGDKVRISRVKATFEKGYTTSWSEEIFTIAQRLPRHPHVYRVKDYNDEIIDGVFYEPELQKVIVNEDTEYVVEKVIRWATRNGRKMSLVKWRGYPNTMNSWVPDTDVIRI
jgi:ribulose bisphosphate carboxylase small subunit